MILIDASVSRQKWISFLSGNLFTTPFQTPAFYDFYNSVDGLSAKVFTVEESDELLALCVITFQKEKGLKGYFSRRAIIYGGPLIAIGDKGKSALVLMLNAISEDLKHKVIFIETRNFNDYFDYKECFRSDAWNYIPYLNVQIDLHERSADDIIGSFKYNRRRELNLSIKEGVTYKVADNMDEVSALYHLLEGIYDKRVNLPLPSLDFFVKLFYSSVGKVFVVLQYDIVIGGSFCFFYPHHSIFTMYYCGLRDHHPKIFPTHLAIWAAIDFGLKNNLILADLMGAGKPNLEYGVRKYKSEFGGKLVEHGRFLKIFNPLLYTLGKTVIKSVKRIKQ
jgi:serine/alanine adding enzyme